MLAAGVYRSVREAKSGARWQGRATVTHRDYGMLVMDEGAWVFGEVEVKGSQQIVLGADFLEVATAFATHRYAFVEKVPDGWDFAAEYMCGDDFYWVWGQKPHINGWKLQMGVAGPSKNEVQLVAYEK